MTTQEVIDLLNHARVLELVSITQYMNHYYKVDGPTFQEAREIFRNTAITEMRHAEMLGERITLLGGSPISDPKKVIEHYGKPLAFPDEVNQMMKADLELERSAIEEYTKAIAMVGDTDPVTRRMFEEILDTEEDHADSFGTYLSEKAAFELKEFAQYKKAA